MLSADGAPTKRYLDYRDKSKSKEVLGEALRQAYEDLFHINEHPSDNDRQAIIGRFKSVHNVTDAVAERQAMTFLSLLKLADISTRAKPTPKAHEPSPEKKKEDGGGGGGERKDLHTFTGLRYNIEIHLPATKDVEVYNAIFKSLKEHLLAD